MINSQNARHYFMLAQIGLTSAVWLLSNNTELIRFVAAFGLGVATCNLVGLAAEYWANRTQSVNHE